MAFTSAPGARVTRYSPGTRVCRDETSLGVGAESLGVWLQAAPAARPNMTDTSPTRRQVSYCTLLLRRQTRGWVDVRQRRHDIDRSAGRGLVGKCGNGSAAVLDSVNGIHVAELWIVGAQHRGEPG